MLFIKIIIHTFILSLLISININAKENKMSIYDFEVKTIDDETISMNKYKDNVLLIVNVASQCGFTPQYKDLEELYLKYKDKNFKILAFPSNQFSKQEPGSNEQIKEFCSVNFNTTFDMFSKIDVNDQNTIPLYKYLKKEASGFLGTKSIKWNFTKFLIDKNGNVIDRYAPFTKPFSIEEDILTLIR